MAGTIVNNPVVQFFDNNGNPLAGGKITTYLSNTTTPASTWQNEGLSILNTNPIILNSRGEATIWLTPDIQYTFVLTDADNNLIQTVNDIYGGFQPSNGMSAANVSYTFPDASVGNVQELSGDNGANGIGYLSPGSDTVSTTVGQKLSEYVSVFDYMTPEQIADVQGYVGALDVSFVVSLAIADCMERQKNLYCPSGKYNVKDLEIPPASYSGPDYRTLGFRIYGDGQGQIFARTAIVGTVFSCTTDNTILTVKNLASPAVGTSGNIEIDHIRFEANSNTVPAVYLQTFYGQSKFDSCGIYQDGTGDGLQVDYIATGQITNNYIINGDWNNFGPVVRTGCGIRFEQAFDGGLATFYKNTCRGFLDGFIIGDGVADPSAVRLEQNECSVVTNGITINANVSGCVLDTNYFEGIEDTCVTDNGNFTKVLNSQMYNGFAIGIDGSLTSNYGSLYQGNYIETSGGQPCTLIKVGSAGTFGGPNKTVTANHLLFSTSGGVVPGVIGIEKIGNNPRFNIFGNAFDPRGPWVGGAGTIKVLDSTTGEGTYGLDFVSAGDYEFPYLAHGAVSLGQSPNALTQADVTGSTLLLPNNASLYSVNASAPTSVNIVDGGSHIHRLVVLQLENTNMTLNKTGQLLLASNFSGPGTITLLTYYIGATKFAIEIARTTI